MIIGGLHLDKLSEHSIEDVAIKMKRFDIENIALSHCSGINAYCIFKRVLNAKITYTGTGYIFTV